MSAPAFDAIVLAAGAGSRFGGGKLLAPWPAAGLGGVVLEGALAAAFATPVRRVTVVTGADGERVEAAARAWAATHRRDARLAVFHVKQWENGMGASLSSAIAAVEGKVRACFVFLGDMPRVPPAVLPMLAEAVRAGAPAAAPVFDGRRGHPALIGAALFPQLQALTGDQGARAVLERLGDRLALVEAPDDGVLYDVDTPADLARG